MITFEAMPLPGHFASGVHSSGTRTNLKQVTAGSADNKLGKEPEDDEPDERPSAERGASCAERPLAGLS